MKKAISLLLAVVMLLSALPFAGVTAFAATSGGYNYNVRSDGTVGIGGYSGKDTALDIPSEIDGYPVTHIYDQAFQSNTSLTSVTIPDSVTNIGQATFSGCTNLISVAIGKGVTSIGISAFSSCSSLTDVTIPNSVTSIGEGAFLNCKSITTINIPSCVLKIGRLCFSGCSSLTDITVESDNENYSSQDGILFNKNKTELIQYPAGSKRFSYTIPSSVTGIGEYAFSHNTSLTSIEIPSNVTSIGDNAFYDCPNLTNVIIPNSVTNVGEYVFSTCANLTSVAIPDSFKKIFKGMFYQSRSLTSIAIPDSVKSVDEWAFHQCEALKDVYYTGTNDQWKRVSISSANGYLNNAEIHYECEAIVTAPTCTEQGYTTYSCPTCENSLICNYVDATGHNYDDGVVTKEATYTETGILTYTCQNCGDKKTGTIAKKTLATPKLSSVANAETGVKIAWGEVAGATMYRVFYKANGESGWHKAADTTSTSYTWTKAASGTKYTFTVRCVDKDGNFISNYDTVGKSITYIAAPKLLSVANVATGVTINWGKVTGAAKYRVFYKTGNSGWKKIADTTSTSYTWTKAASGTKYTFTVRCVDSSGTNFTSAYDTAGKSLTYIAAPKLSSLANTTTGVQIKWGKVTGAAKYRVFYKTGNGSWKKIADTTSTNYTWKGAKSGTKYTFTVRCVDKDGNFTSAYDTTGKSLTYVAAPKLSAIENTTTGVKITWGKATGATNYRVFYKANGESSWTKIADTTSTSYTWTKASSGTKYTFTVRCVDKDGNFISAYDTTGKSLTYVAAPKLSSVSNAATGVTIKWGKVDGAAKYRVFYKASGESSWHKAADTTSTSYTWTGAKSGTKYIFTVRCITSDGSSFTSAYDSTGKSITR